MVIKATLMKMNVVEAPTTLSPDGRSRPPHLRPYRDGWRHLRFMALFSPNWLFLYPGLSLIALGLALGGVLLAHPVYVGGVRFSVDTLIYCVTMIEVGFQAVLFALLSRTYAIQEGLFPTPLQASLFDRWFSLERGVVFGAALLLVGALLLYKALSIWAAAQFGPLDVEHVTPVVISSSLSLSLGFEIILSSFLLSMLKLNVRTMPALSSQGGDDGFQSAA
jgi:hypothetical protein